MNRTLCALLLVLLAAPVLAGENKTPGKRDIIFHYPKDVMLPQLGVGTLETLVGLKFLESAGVRPLEFTGLSRFRSIHHQLLTAEERVVQMQRWREAGFGGQLMRGARAFAGLVLISDAAGRIYVWEAYDADPGLSPLLTYVSYLTGVGIPEIPTRALIRTKVSDESGVLTYKLDSALSDAANKVAASDSKVFRGRLPGELGLITVETLVARGLLRDAPRSTLGRIRYLQQTIEELKTNSEFNNPAGVRAQLYGKYGEVAKGLSERTAVEAEELHRALGTLGKAFRVVQVVGSAVVIIDVLGRVYVWTAGDGQPEFSPIATLMANGTARAYGWYTQRRSPGPPGQNRFLNRFERE